jgi:putative DNA primase/helicase
MGAAGIVPPAAIIADGALHRFHIEGHRHGSKNGAYVFHRDRKPAGWFQDYKSGVSGTWTAGGGRWHLDQATRHAIEAERQRRLADTAERHARKAREAQADWGAASLCLAHAYLTRKAVEAHGLRVADWRRWIEDGGRWREIVIPGALLVPMRDEAGTLWNLQGIFSVVHPELGRDKDFRGGRKAGLFHIIGEASGTVRIAEGYATGATVHRMTGDRVFVAFDCGNLEAVARTARKLHPAARIVICADNDRFTVRPIPNPGVAKARAAALAVGGFVAIPQFPEGATGTDWNDWAALRRGANHGGT